ncbi:MAG: ABC transporter ATP-binding protein [Candidatus Latescibacteria bacterium]|nr:ABC transporter ATP-binding protein [Candidatus Latescibacterota bacterium]
MSAVIELSGVSKWFGPVQALDDVSLTVWEGEFVSLIGPSGCGKTTLLRIVAGLEEPTRGEVQVNDDLPLVACRKHQIGVAFQQTALVASRTALSNVQLTLEIVGCENSMSPEKVLQDFGLGKFLQSYPYQLSGGMQQRVNIACALVHNPRVLLLDEPFGALDELTREAMGVWLSQILAGTEQTVLFVTHSVEEAVALSDRVIVLSHRPGRIVGTVGVEFPRPCSRETRMEGSFLRKVAKVRQALYSVLNKEGIK